MSRGAAPELASDRPYAALLGDVVGSLTSWLVALAAAALCHLALR